MRSSLFESVPVAPADPILGVTEAFRNDPSPDKVNLGVGVYQDAEGRIPVLECVKEAAKRWLTAEDSKTYLPIDGVASFNSATQALLFGADSAIVKEQRAATIQSVGGSGALKLGIEFLRRFLPDSAVYLSDPSWENHRAVFEAAGARVENYPYYDPKTCGLKASEMLETLRKLPEKTAVLLHGSCHNPTGVDLEPEHWREVVTICTERNLVPMIDFAYQGFGQGITEDALPIKLFSESGLQFLVMNSYAKSFSIYRERVGALTVVTSSKAEAQAVLSQIKRIVRTIYSSPPSYGAQLVSIVLNDPELRKLWESELGEMRTRIQEMRQLFVELLKEKLPSHDFSFIMKQRGMFSYSGLSRDVILELRERYHIYALESGRICVAAMNRKNVPYICDAIASVLSK